MSAHESSGKSLSQRRGDLEAQWSRFRAGSPFVKPAAVRDEIFASWRRSQQALPAPPPAAPADDQLRVIRRWTESPLAIGAASQMDHLKQLTREGAFVAAIADARGQLMWTHASRHMRERAERVNFTAGGRWDEGSVGTNAVGLSLALRQSVTVFSSEHFQSFVHDWVCYAAPIVHPQTGQTLGVLDVSTTWKRHTPLGQAAVAELARNIAAGLPSRAARAELEIHALGQPNVTFRGQALRLTRRQLEILCLLALNPQGLNLEAFHAALYGDAGTSTTTLKAELSQLRGRLDGCIGSRPYRLTCSVWADFIDLWQLLLAQQVDEAVSLYRGTLLPLSASPEIEEWRHCIDAVMGKALDFCKDPKLLMRKLCEGSPASELMRERLTAVLSD